MKAAFNYISYANHEIVLKAGDPEIRMSMMKGRMFEYTPPSISESLLSLNSEALNFLEGLPTFLVSEVYSRSTMAVRFGRISNIIKTYSEVSFNFETVFDFGEIEFESLSEIKTIFLTDDYQPYRTHWSVRSNDHESILEELKNKSQKTVVNGDSANYLSGFAVHIPSQDNSKNIAGEASDVESYLNIIFKMGVSKDKQIFFRGHSNSNYQLTPSVLRKSESGSWQHLVNEDVMIRELLISDFSEFNEDQFCFDKLVRMQHFGLPTRLLDISTNPLVPLYFSCLGKDEVDGEVIVITVKSSDIKYYDSDTVSCLSQLSSLTFEQKNSIDFSLCEEKFNSSDVIKRLLHYVKREKPYFEPRIVPSDLQSIICVKAKKTNDRIKSQSGAFLLFGHEAILNESGDDGVEIQRITIKNKSHIRDQLNLININRSTVYPSIDQTASHITLAYRQDD